MSNPQAIGRWARVKLLVMALATLAATALPPSAQSVGDLSAAELMDALMWGHQPLDTSFSLTDHHGKPRTLGDFRGKVLIVYFGYMFCPDICPTDLQMIAQAIERLGPKGDAVQPLFITLDPDRDTAEGLAKYVPLFHPRLVGLTGTPAQIRRVARGYKVYFARSSEGKMSAYLLDHTAFIYLVDAGGGAVPMMVEIR